MEVVSILIMSFFYKESLLFSGLSQIIDRGHAGEPQQVKESVRTLDWMILKSNNKKLNKITFHFDNQKFCFKYRFYVRSKKVLLQLLRFNDRRFLL